MVENLLILPITPGLKIPEHIENACINQLRVKLERGFPEELDRSSQEYVAEYGQAVADVAEKNPGPEDLIALVEPRIPFVRQLALLGIDLDPALYAFPKHIETHRPYGVVLQVIDRGFPEIGRLRLGRMIEGLPEDLRAASPFEGISADIDLILERSFVAMPGGEVCKTSGLQTGLNGRFSIPCLETFKGKPRISYIHPNSTDGLVGVLAVIR